MYLIDITQLPTYAQVKAEYIKGHSPHPRRSKLLAWPYRGMQVGIEAIAAL